MFQPFTLFVAWRYLRARRRNRFASFVSLVSVAGIALGVAALVIVLSVMNGFEREVTRHVLGMSAHALIVERGGTIAAWRELATALGADARVVAAAPYVRASGMLSHRGRVTGVLVEGVLPEAESAVSDLAGYLGDDALAALRPGHGHVLIGDSLARKLAIETGGMLTLVVPDWDASGAALAPRYTRLRVAGVFHVGMHQYDARLVLMHADDARSIFHLGARVSGLRVRFTDAALAPSAARELVRALGSNLEVIDWSQYHRNFFMALKSQKRIMFVILVLIIAVAAFNIAANMIMLVTEKIRDIGILRTLGATRRQMVALFLAQGFLLGLLGAGLGGILGAWGAQESAAVARFIESTFGLDLINADVYFIDYLPADLRVLDLASITAASLLLSLLATIYPAWRAAAIDPVEAIRHE